MRLINQLMISALLKVLVNEVRLSKTFQIMKTGADQTELVLNF
jgi:hypothetical protein